MKCDICEREVEKTIPFYWGFFKTEYEPEKWVNACPDCCRKFQRASHGYNYNRNELIEFEAKIKEQLEKKKVKVRRK